MLSPKISADVIAAHVLNISSQDSLHIKLNIPLGQGIRNRSLAETFNKRSDIEAYELKADAETVQDWKTSPPPLELYYHETLQNWSFHLHIGILRDFEAWYREEQGLQIPLNTNELNINAQPEFWASYDSHPVRFKLGQFQPHYSPSQDRGVVLSGPNLHKGIESSLSLRRFHFSWFWSSLDPHLNRQELEFQSTSPVVNAREVVYDQLSKNLFIHRLEYETQSLKIGMMECLLIGGKSPELWETQPFNVYHNNYPDGYGNTMLSFDFVYKFLKNNQVSGEISLDDLIGGPAEDKNTNSNIMAWNLSYLFTQKFPSGEFSAQLEYIHVDPSYGNRDLPLLQYTHREVLKSNFRSLDLVANPNLRFSDTYVVDHPIGYFRGPDVVDIWLDLAWSASRWRSNYQLGYLQKGAYDFDTPFKQSTNNPKVLTSPIWKEFRQSIGLEIKAWNAITFSTKFIYRSWLSQPAKLNNNDPELQNWAMQSNMGYLF